VEKLARVELFIKGAVPLFVLGTALLFVLHETKLLDLLERCARPLIVSLLGLPAKATEAFMIGFLRRDYGAAGLFMLAKEGLLDSHQILVSLVTITLFIPCIAQLFMMIKERGLKKAFWMTAIIFPLAFGVGGLLHWAMRFLGV
jgi:ferrous iron transport protein B